LQARRRNKEDSKSGRRRLRHRGEQQVQLEPADAANLHPISLQLHGRMPLQCWERARNLLSKDSRVNIYPETKLSFTSDWRIRFKWYSAAHSHFWRLDDFVYVCFHINKLDRSAKLSRTAESADLKSHTHSQISVIDAPINFFAIVLWHAETMHSNEVEQFFQQALDISGILIQRARHLLLPVTRFSHEII
jgi:hypothetical protein